MLENGLPANREGEEGDTHLGHIPLVAIPTAMLGCQRRGIPSVQQTKKEGATWAMRELQLEAHTCTLEVVQHVDLDTAGRGV
jgi:hypothetical protein